MVLALTTPIGAALLAGLALLWFRGAFAPVTSSLPPPIGEDGRGRHLGLSKRRTLCLPITSL
jgi:hypothetical protein